MTVEAPPRCETRDPWHNRRCERDAGHEGYHMTGLAPGSNLIHGWGDVRDKEDK